MRPLRHRLVNTPVEREIDHLIGRAACGSGFLRAGEHAHRLWKAHPGCGLTGEEIVDEIILAATKAGVAVEMQRPQSPPL